MRTLLVTSSYSPSRVLPFGIVFPSALLWDSVNPRLSEKGGGRGGGAERSRAVLYFLFMGERFEAKGCKLMWTETW